MDKIEEILTRGVDKIIPSKEELEKVLRSEKRLRVYQGFDPSTPELHIGHMVGLRKLRQWQDLGHEVIFLIGDFTGMIGDPTGKDKTRPLLTREQVLKNAKSYKEQAGRVLRFSGKNPVRIKYNSEWLSKLTIPELAKYMSYLTYQQVIERDMFQERLQKNMDIAISELMYPFMQGYDSVAMDIDVEVGGSDQLFNMMTGRDLMHKIKRKNKFVMTTPLLVDSTGKKIGKTEGNAIALTAPPEQLYGMIMSLGDDVIVKCLEYITDTPLEQVKEIAAKIESGENPMIYKKELAFTLTTMLNNKDNAQKAQDYFEKTVQNQEIPSKIPSYQVSSSKYQVVDLLVESQLASSKSEAKRLIEQGGVEVDNKKITDPNLPLEIKDDTILKVGKRKFLRLRH